LVGARANHEDILATTLKRRSTILDLPLATMHENRGTRSESRIRHSRVDVFILGFAGHDVHELTAAATRLGNAARILVDKGT
jgi:hypothetical protein